MMWWPRRIGLHGVRELLSPLADYIGAECRSDAPSRVNSGMRPWPHAAPLERQCDDAGYPSLLRLPQQIAMGGFDDNGDDDDERY